MTTFYPPGFSRLAFNGTSAPTAAYAIMWLTFPNHQYSFTFMTDKEKLNQLFQAALKDVSDGSKPLARVFPKQESVAVPAPVTQPEPALAAIPQATPVMETLVVPMENAGLDHAASAELGAMLDEQNARMRRKRNREKIFTLAACLTLTGGCYGWFVHSPERVEAFYQTIRDIRSVGDVKGMIASYTKALEKISVRSQQIDQSTRAMGVSTNQDNEKDPNFDAEMKTMSGGEGKTVGDRNKMLQDAFGKEIGGAATPVSAGTPDTKPVDKPATKVAAGDSFD